MNRRLLLIAASLTLALLPGCKQGGSQASKAPAHYRTVRVTTSDQTLETKYAAIMEGQQLVEIRPQVSGTITQICFNEGDKLSKGQTLFILDQVPYKAAVEVADANVKSAEAKLRTAKLTADSNKQLFEQDVISGYELQTAQNALAEAQAAYAQAKAQMTTAPVNGVASMTSYRVGALVSSSIASPLVTVSDDSYMYVYFSLSENQILDLMSQFGSQEKFLSGMPDVSLQLSNGRRYEHSGRIDAVSGVIDQSTGSVRLRARFPNPSRLLRSGASATLIIPVSVKDCIAIPQTATFEIQEKVFVYKVIDGKAESFEIKVFALNNGTDYIVESGLEVGDVIVAEGAGLLREGTLISTEDGKE